MSCGHHSRLLITTHRLLCQAHRVASHSAHRHRPLFELVGAKDPAAQPPCEQPTTTANNTQAVVPMEKGSVQTRRDGGSILRGEEVRRGAIPQSVRKRDVRTRW